MSVFLEQHSELLQALNKHRVPFIVIGGYAVIHYGYKRTTGDLDLWIKPDNAIKDDLVEAFLSLGYSIEELRQLQAVDLTSHTAFSILEDPERADFVTRIGGLDFEEAWSMREVFSYGELRVSFLYIDHLIISKMSTGRIKDLADVEMLQKIRASDIGEL